MIIMLPVALIESLLRLCTFGDSDDSTSEVIKAVDVVDG